MKIVDAIMEIGNGIATAVMCFHILRCYTFDTPVTNAELGILIMLIGNVLLFKVTSKSA